MARNIKAFLRQLNKPAVVVALLHFVLGFLTDRIMFDYVWMDFTSTKNICKSLWAIGVKAGYLVLLLALWQGIFYFVKKADRTFVKIAIAYFLLQLCLLLLVWPGIWRMDEFSLLSNSVQLMPHFWQNYITSVFYIYSMMLLPFPAGVIIMQCVCISLVVARMLTLCARSMKGRQKRPHLAAVLLGLPFWMFPVLDSNLYPLRMSLYAFLEVLLLAELYFYGEKETGQGNHMHESNAKDSNRHDNGQNSNGEIFFWARIVVLAAIVTVWRTEAIYYLLLFPLLLFLLERTSRKKKILLWRIGCYIILTVILFSVQKVGEKMTSGQQYELTSTVLPLVPLVEEADKNGDDALLARIDRVVNVDVVLEGAKQGRSGISLFWGEPDFQRDYTEEEFADFKSAYYKLILTYPGTFLKERWQTFLASSGLLENTTELFTAKGVPNYDTFRTYPLSKPISDELRTGVIKILELRSRQDYMQKLPVTDFVYSAIPAIVILIITFVICLAKRRWTAVYVTTLMLVKVPLVFLTAPSRLFMYYYSPYLFGYCTLFYFLACCGKRKGETS